MTAHSISADEFASHSRKFVAWCETKHVEESDEHFRSEAQRLIAMLYAVGCGLELVPFMDWPDIPDLTKSQLDGVAANLARLPFRHYWSVFVPSEIGDGIAEPSCGDLLDDFLDIYRDIRHGLMLFDSGHSIGAVYHWHQMFSHWGHHVLDALSALHSYDPESSNTI